MALRETRQLQLVERQAVIVMCNICRDSLSDDNSDLFHLRSIAAW